METQEKRIGAKKIALVSADIVENIREHEVSKCLANGEMDALISLMYNYCMSGGNLCLRDMRTKESFLHILADYTHLYLSPGMSRIFYILCIKLDVDYKNVQGDTALHKIVRVPGAWRAIVALMRCGANPLIKNKAGRTPEEEILFHKGIGYEENLHWLRKFLPGLWAAVLSRQPDLALVERLLRYWCRTAKMEGNEPKNLKCVMNMNNAPLDFVCIVEKYENTNEMALSMLSGKCFMVDHWKRTKENSSVDVNTKDLSYQYHYREYPTAPRPLLAAVWEMDDFDLIKAFMHLEPNMAVKYTFESEASSPPKPLFFQLVNPKCRPHNEAITAYILGLSDLNMRTQDGWTILMEALHNRETEGVIRTILNAGVNLAARDGKGLTARDHADILKRPDYRQLIDSRIAELMQSGDAATLETFVLQMYPYITPVAKLQHCCHLSKGVNDVLKRVSSTQSSVQKLFLHVKDGNKCHVSKALTREFAPCRDKAGRTLLHYAVQHSHASYTMSNKSDETIDQHTTNDETLSDSRIILIDNLAPNTMEIGEKDKIIGKGIKPQNKKCQSTVRPNGWKKHCPFRHLRPCFYFKPDHLGIIEHLVKEFPYMVDLQNSFGQTPLHYAYIYSADQAVIDVLEKAGSHHNTKDVFDLVPKDYSKKLCGEQTYNVRRKATVDLDLDIYLQETNFKDNFYKAILSGNVEAVKKLAVPLISLGGCSRFTSVLFDCLDMGQFDVAWSLIEAGFPTSITKQYESCNPDDPMCAMMECSHAVTTLKQRALDTGAVEMANLIDSLNKDSEPQVIVAT